MTKYGGTFFPKKALHGGTNIFEQIFLGGGGGMFYMGTNDQSMQGEKLVVKRFQRSSQVSFPLTDLDLGY